MKSKHAVSALLTVSLLASSAVLPTQARETSLGSYPTEIGAISVKDEAEQSPLYQKNALFLGDSLCNARGEREAGLAHAGYAGRIGVRYHMNFKNNGASGFTVSTAKSSIMTMLQNAYGDNNMREDPIAYDLVVLQGGVNDAWFNAPLGEISDSFSYRDFDRHTFAGGLESIICRAKEYFPEATVCYLIMYRMPLAQWSQNGGEMEPVEGVRNMDEYVALQRQILEKWEIPYLDFYGDDAFNNDVFKVETTTYLSGDYVHMTSSGYDLIFRYIAAWLETLPLPERIVEETESESESIGASEESESESSEASEEKSESDTEPVKPETKGGIPKIIPIAAIGGLLVAALGAIALICLRKRR